MNIRPGLLVLLIGLALFVTGAVHLPAAHAEFWRPLTWGEKKPATTSRQKKKNTGVIGGTKRVLSNTADALTPWDNNKKKPANSIEGAGRFLRPDLPHQQRDNGSTWYRPATWVRGRQQEEKPLTVPDWMSQERPGFENR